METHEDDRGLRFALNSNYTKKQYEKALTRVAPLNDDYNQLLNALIDVASSEEQSSISSSTNYPDSTSDADNTSSGSSRSITYSTTSQSSQLQNNEQLDQLKPIYVDGQNVAKCHGNNEQFSWFGVKLCADWFHQRGHDVFIFMPEPKCTTTNEEDEKIIKYLHDLKFLIRTPTGCSDDLFILEVATKKDGIVVSNDQFRDEKKNNEKYLKKFIDCRRLPFTFCHDEFIPYPYPRGPYGPSLEEFLKIAPVFNRSASDGRYQKNRRKWTTSRWGSSEAQGSPSPFFVGNKSWHHQERTRLKATTSLPIGVQSTMFNNNQRMNHPQDNSFISNQKQPVDNTIRKKPLCRSRSYFVESQVKEGNKNQHTGDHSFIATNDYCNIEESLGNHQQNQEDKIVESQSSEDVFMNDHRTDQKNIPSAQSNQLILANSHPRLMRTTSNHCGPVHFQISPIDESSNMSIDDGSVKDCESQLARTQGHGNTKNSQLEYCLNKLFEIVPPWKVCNVMKRLNAEDVQVETIVSKLVES